MATSSTAQAGVLGRLWSRYLITLRARPIRTKMITSGTLYVVGDWVAQFGIEGRSLRRDEEGGDRHEDRKVYDPIRTLRLGFYGGFLFAPLAHHWLNNLERVKLARPLPTLAARLSLDFTLWSPFLCALFPVSLGLLEGKKFEQIRQKVEYGWFPTWQKAVMVFGPTQLINLTFTPPQHRLLVLQSVGLCWGIFLSWQNNRTNRTLASAELALAHATTAAEQLDAQKKIEAAEKKKEELAGSIGEDGVATRMSWS